MEGRRLGRLAVERLQRGKEEAFMAADGFGSEFLREACRAEEAYHGVGRVMPGRREQLAEMLESAELSQAGSAIAMLGLADERNRSAGGPRPGAAGERQDVDLVAGLVLAAGDDSLSDRADGKALLRSRVAGGPLGGDRLEVRPVNLGLNGVRRFGPDLGRLAGLQVG